MASVNNRKGTRERIMEAAVQLFLDLGYQKTSIARIESEAGLVPRAGAFYRHFESKQALLFEVARTYVSETPEDFGLDRLADFGDTRAELVAIALKYEEAALRQQPYARLIEEVRLLDFGSELQDELNADMFSGLQGWLQNKPGIRGMSELEIAAFVITVFGGWMTYLVMLRQGASITVVRDTLLNEWASHWAQVLDAPR